MFAAVRPAALLMVAIAFAIAGANARPAVAHELPEEAAPPSESELAGWIERLDHLRFAEREKASDALVAAGAPAVKYLLATLRSRSLEASDRAVGILEEFSRRADLPLRLASLEALSEANRFPAARRGAIAQLADLREEIFQKRFETLGAEFTVTSRRRTSAGMVTAIEITIDPKKWKGTPKDFEPLWSLRRVETLQITAPMIDDAVVKQLAKMESLRHLTLIHTAATVEVVGKVKKDHPELRIILRGRALLGIALGNGGDMTISGFDPVDGAAAKSGLKPGDIIQAFNGKPVEHFDALTAQIAQHAPGDSVEITVLRGDKTRTFTTVLAPKDWTKNGSPY